MTIEPNELMKIAPTLREGVDLRELDLSAQEGFLLSQVDGITPAGVLCDLVAMDRATLTTALMRLEKLGAVRWSRRDTGPTTRGASTSDTVKQHEVAAGALWDPALSEECDLSRDERLQILKAEHDLNHQTFWQILGLAIDPTSSDIKRAYFSASKSFHPDRFFGRNLGTFRERLERIFHRLTVAHDTLVDERKRAAYQARYPPPWCSPVVDPPGPSGVSETSEEREARLERRRQEIIAARKAKKLNSKMRTSSTVEMAHNAKAEEMYRDGLNKLKAGEVFRAVAAFKLAVTYEPQNATYRAMFEEANGQAMIARAVEVVEQAESAAQLGQVDNAARLWARAFEMAPNRSEYAIRAAEQYLAAGDHDAALRLALQAIDLAPRRLEAQIITARALEACGDAGAALKQWKIAGSLDPSDGHVKKAIRRLSKSLS
jgi:tetratricopeptide (TPR) repeat protein